MALADPQAPLRFSSTMLWGLRGTLAASCAPFPSLLFKNVLKQLFSPSQTNFMREPNMQSR